MALYTVNTAEDIDDFDNTNNVMSLREAIRLSNDNASLSNSIVFDSTVFADGGTITLSNENDNGDLNLATQSALTVTSNISIDGDVNDDGIADITISGDMDGNDDTVMSASGHTISDVMGGTFADNSRIFQADDRLQLNSLVLTGGNFSAIHASDDLELNNVVIAGNRTEIDGAGVAAYGSLAVYDSLFESNSADGDGGAIAASTGTYQTVDISGTTFLGNTAANFGGAIDIDLDSSVLRINDTTFAANTARDDSAMNVRLGALSEYMDGADVYAAESEVFITNSTFVDNVTTDAFSSAVVTLDGDGDIFNPALSQISQSTFTGNTSSSEDFRSITTSLDSATSEIEISNTLILGNDSDYLAPTDDAGGNLNTGNVADVFANLSADGTSGVLTDNGGTVQTVALKASAGNAAVDAVRSMSRSDARDEDRGSVTGKTETPDDIGAFELRPGDFFAAGGTSDLVVNTVADVSFEDINLFDDVLSLREAIMIAGDGDTITFDADVFSDANFADETSTIRLRDYLVIENSITINGDTDGDGDADVVISGDTLGNDDTVVAADGGAILSDISDFDGFDDRDEIDDVEALSLLEDNAGGIYIVGSYAAESAPTVALNGLVITGSASEVGAIYAGQDSTVTISNALIAGNIGYYGAIKTGGDLTIRNSSITDNVGARAGAIVADGRRDKDEDEADTGQLIIQDSLISGNVGGIGGGIYTNADTTITGTTISDNSANIGGGVVSTGNFSMSSSLVSGNRATLAVDDGRRAGPDDVGGIGGGLVFAAGYDADSGGSVVLTNVTLADNIAEGNGSAIALYGTGFTGDHLTITGNQALLMEGEDEVKVEVVVKATVKAALEDEVEDKDEVESASVIYEVPPRGNDFEEGRPLLQVGDVTINNSLIVGNAVNSEDQLNLAIGLGGENNLISNDAALIFAETRTTVTEDGSITSGVLADNGGEVFTVALLASADNAALDNAADSDVLTDARGRTRSDFAGLGLGIADLGAFELINAAPVVTTLSAQTVVEGQSAVVDLNATDAVASEGSGLTYEITGGVDAAIFAVDENTGEVTFKAAPNFEAPTDTGGDNVYNLTVAANDGTSVSALNLAVTVTDLAEKLSLIGDPAGGALTGGDEDDVITGAFGDDVVTGGLGDDIILDPGGDDTIDAGGGNDRVGLLSGMNTVSGGDGDDLIVGGFGNDDLSGDAGADIIRGDVSTRLAGSDRIDGGTGNDLLEGRGGVDTFVFKTGDGADTIGALSVDYFTPANTTVTGPDFVSGVDLIELSGFGLADTDAAFAKVTDVGGVATFSDQGTTITFTGLTADDLAADDFILV